MRERRVESPSLTRALAVGRGDLVSLVGGGGKTTLMYRLVAELRAGGLCAAAATTTKIQVPDPGAARLVCAARYEAAAEALSAPGDRRTPVLGREVLGGGKVDGVPPEWCDRLVGEGRVDALVVEADGAGRRPVKAPEAWEPVVPAGTTVFVAVVGLSALGRAVDGDRVFRPERVREVTGLGPGAPLDPEALARLLASPGGLAKGCPDGARAVAFLNQADLPGAEDGARRVARLLLDRESLFERVVVGSLEGAAPIREVCLR
ncbi:MAG: selenium cofactor biosynthesis protein YqeC [Deferrisomatales bacterium]